MLANMDTKWIKQWFNKIFRHEGAPGEFVASFMAVGYSTLAYLSWGLIGPLRSILALSEVVPIEATLGLLFFGSWIHIMFLVADGRWTRWVTSSILLCVWLTLAWNLLRVAPWHPVAFLYLLPAGIYAYGTMYLLKRRSVR